MAEPAVTFWVEKLWSAGMVSAEVGPWRIDINDGEIARVVRGHPDGDLVIVGTAVPGFIDMHDHIGIDPGDERAQAEQQSGDMLLRGAANLRTMLDGGVTTVRDCGERADVEAFWVRAVADGVLPGPRIIRSISPIARTGGHAWYLARETDGVDAVRSRVRELARSGAAFIKVMVSGGLGTVGSEQSRAEYTREELFALVDEASRLGLPVAAHGHGGPGVDDAIAAGVRTIEHGLLLTPAQLDAMASSGVALILTAGIVHAFAACPQVPASIRQAMPRFVERAVRLTSLARAAGVEVAVGCDGTHGQIGREAQLMVEGGYTVAEALSAATHAASTILGLPALGVLSAGAIADVVVLAGDPFQDSACLTAAPAGVMHNGAWHRVPSACARAAEPSDVH